MRLAAIRHMFKLGPLLFAAGFLTPLGAQLIEAFGLTPPFGLSPLLCSFIVAMAAATLAQIRGRWI